MITYPATLAEVYNLYIAELPGIDRSLLKTTLTRYTLPGYLECPPDTLKGKSDSDLMVAMQKVSTEQLGIALEVQDRVFGTFGDSITASTRSTYRCHLRRFLKWISEQEWHGNRPKSLDYAPRKRFKGVSTANIKMTSRKQLPDYRLTEDQISPDLRGQLSAFQNFWSREFNPSRQSDPLRRITIDYYTEILLRMLGWVHLDQGIQVQGLRLESLIPDTTIRSTIVIADYVAWLKAERKAVNGTCSNVLRASVALAKFLFHKETDRGVAKKFQDLPVIEALRQLAAQINKAAEHDTKVADPKLKEMTLDQYLQVVQELKRECAERTSSGHKRSNTTIAYNKQSYLICAIFSLFPDRQRTLRELEVGRTLIKEDGVWFIQHNPEDYKTGEIYGFRKLEFPPELVPDLEDWLDVWRGYLKPQHNYVFTQRNGHPFSETTFGSMFQGAVYRTSYQLFGEGKALNPHGIRHIIVRHFAHSGATDQEMRSLALLMAHSEKTQRESYDLSSYEQKTEAGRQLLRRMRSQP